MRAGPPVYCLLLSLSLSLLALLLFCPPLTMSSSSYPVVGPEELMSAKAHGTCTQPVQSKLRYNCDVELADRICCFNRHYAEHSGYFTGAGSSTTFLQDVDRGAETTYYDSVTGRPLFVAPRGRTFEQFLSESRDHGWPSFRDEEVLWDGVRCLSNGETVSVDGTHLGHNLPDGRGNRYCINLVSVAGFPVSPEDQQEQGCADTGGEGASKL